MVRVDQAERSRVRKIRSLGHTPVQSGSDIKTIYLDHAATTPLRPRVLDAMMPYLTEHHGNPSSVYGPGRRARSAVEEARTTVADLFGVEPGDVVFTSGGTESDNMALRGVLLGQQAREDGPLPAVAVSRTEHDAVVRTAEALEHEGRRVIWMDTASDGTVPVESVRRALDAGAGLVSIMHVNNETGAVNDLGAASRACREAGVPLHTDAVQSAGFYNLTELADIASLISLSAHKVGGPKGVGLLIGPSAGVDLDPLIRGGRQERDRRAGTENVAGIVGAAEALRLAADERDQVATTVRRLRDQLQRGLVHALGDTVAINTPESSAPHILNIVLTDASGSGLDGEMLVLGLDVEGLCVSTGSACSSGTVKPSRVLLEMGLTPDRARGAVRFSLGRTTTESEIDRAIDLVVRVTRRMMSS